MVNSSEVVETCLVPPTEEPPIIDVPLSLPIVYLYVPLPYGEVPLWAHQRGKGSSLLQHMGYQPGLQAG